MELSEEVMKEIERISHERIQEINGTLDEALKYLAELKYPVAPKKFDPTGTINQYHEAKRQGAVFGMKIALTSPELLSKAGWVKNEEWISVKDKKPTRQDADENGYIECAFWNNSKMEYYRGSAIWFTIANGESDLTMWKRQIPLPSPPQNK